MCFFALRLLFFCSFIVVADPYVFLILFLLVWFFGFSTGILRFPLDFETITCFAFEWSSTYRRVAVWQCCKDYFLQQVDVVVMDVFGLISVTVHFNLFQSLSASFFIFFSCRLISCCLVCTRVRKLKIGCVTLRVTLLHATKAGIQARLLQGREKSLSPHGHALLHGG